MNATTTVKNLGGYSETFNVTAYYNEFATLFLDGGTTLP